MSSFLSNMTKNDSRTENNMPAHSTSDSACLDLYYNLGTRTLRPEVVDALFVKAYREDPVKAIKILFYNRDIRGGRGERNSFRTILKNHVTYLSEVLHLVPEYGRWDDLLEVVGEDDSHVNDHVFSIIEEGLKNKNGLCAKWMPRKGRIARLLREYLGLTPKQYRKRLVGLTQVVETSMCANEWEEIDFNKVPSKASMIYAKAFNRHEPQRYAVWRDKLKTGEAKINVSTLYPHEIVQQTLYDSSYPYNEAWDKLLTLFPKHQARVLPVCDVSESMDGLPLEVSVSLGIFLSQLNTGAFKDVFCTFSARPQLQILKGTLAQRVYQLSRADWSMNTNLEAVFELIVKAAKKSKPEDVPSMVLILSDMQFDEAVNYPDANAMKMIKKQFKEMGLDLPKVVFWNLRAVPGTMPVKSHKSGAALVSGFSPVILKTLVEEGNLENFTPLSIMDASINVPRYQPIEDALRG